MLSQARRSSTVDGGEVISEIEASNTMNVYIKSCKIIGSIKIYLFIYLFIF